MDLAGGQYRFAWTTAPGCTSFAVEVAPTTGGTTIKIPIANVASGEVTVPLPAGKAYINRIAGCDYELRVEAAS